MANGKTNTTTTAEQTAVGEGEFLDLDFTPTRRSSGGRAKTALRVKIESLEPGRAIYTGLQVTEENEKQVMGKVRSMTGDISSKNPGHKFSVYVSEDERLPTGAVIVERKGE